MNKGLEVIEAHFLFGLPYDRIEVVVHPQSIVHGMARMRDGALIAHVGHPDMRVPDLLRAHLSATARATRGAAARPRRSRSSLTFEPPDTDTFRCLALARAAGEAGGTAPCVLNAANEEAVAAFLAGRDRLPRHRGAGRRRARRRARSYPVDEPRGGARRPTRRRAPPSPTRLGAVGVSYARRHPRPAALVFIHELGHFLAAKSVGARATKFYVGFPPALSSAGAATRSTASARSRSAAT